MSRLTFGQAAALQAEGVEIVEVIQTSYQTGMLQDTIRGWDGLPPILGSLERREGREDGVYTVSPPIYEPHAGSAD